MAKKETPAARSARIAAGSRATAKRNAKRAENAKDRENRAFMARVRKEAKGKRAQVHREFRAKIDAAAKKEGVTSLVLFSETVYSGMDGSDDDWSKMSEASRLYSAVSTMAQGMAFDMLRKDGYRIDDKTSEGVSDRTSGGGDDMIVTRWAHVRSITAHWGKVEKKKK